VLLIGILLLERLTIRLEKLPPDYKFDLHPRAFISLYYLLIILRPKIPGRILRPGNIRLRHPGEKKITGKPA
jgi:hypothetical protein